MDHTYRLHTHSTSNGIRVVVNPDSWVSGVAVNLWYGVGSVHETAGKTGFAHLFEHLMFSGSANVASGEHLALLQAIGGNTNATTSFDRTNYFETVPRGGLDLALWLEADRLAFLLDGVDQVNLDTQREVVKEEKRLRYDNQPYGDAFPELMRLVFPGEHPYAHMPIGSMADLDSAALADVHAFFERHYRPDNLILTLSGAIGPDEGFALVERFFAGISPGGHPEPPAPSPLEPMTGIPRLGMAADVPQDVIYAAWRVPPIADAAHDSLAMALAILSGSMTSRLHNDLVRTGLADSADAFDLGLAYGNSVIVATAACAEGVAPERLEEAMMDSWAAFTAGGPTPGEVARAAKAEERDYLADLASVEDRADHISAALSLFGDAEEVNRHLDGFRALTPAGVASAAATWLAADNRAVLTYRSAS